MTPADGTIHSVAVESGEATSVMCLPPCRRRVTIGKCTLYLGDCAALLPYLERVPGVLTDRPYGLGRVSGGSGKHGVQKWGGENDLRWDRAPTPLMLEATLRAADYHMVWGGNFLPLGPAKCFLVWDKGACFKNRRYAEAELAWTSLRSNTRIFVRDPLAHRDYKGKVHPTQKPLALILWCIELLPKGCHTILDPFMGSGTTGVACARLGRRFLGVEREERLFDLACRRIADEVT